MLFQLVSSFCEGFTFSRMHCADTGFALLTPHPLQCTGSTRPTAKVGRRRQKNCNVTTAIFKHAAPSAVPSAKLSELWEKPDRHHCSLRENAATVAYTAAGGAVHHVLGPYACAAGYPYTHHHGVVPQVPNLSKDKD